MTGERPLCDAATIDGLISTMADEIADGPCERASRSRLVGVRTRGVPLAERLAERTAARWWAPMSRSAPWTSPSIATTWASSRRWPVLHGTEIPFAIEGADVVLVDDVAVHRPDRPCGPERRLRPRPTGLGPAGRAGRPGPSRAADPPDVVGLDGRDDRGPTTSGCGFGRSTPVDEIVADRAGCRPADHEPGDRREAASRDRLRHRPRRLGAGLEPQAPARPGRTVGRGDHRHPRHGRVVRRDLDPQPQEGPRAPGPDRLQPLLRELDPHPDQLQPGGQAAVGRHPGLLRQRVEPLQGRDVHRHREEHRGDGGRRPGRPPPDARHAPPAGPARRLLDHQRRRRRARAPHAGPARPHDHPPGQGADRRA